MARAMMATSLGSSGERSASSSDISEVCTGNEYAAVMTYVNTHVLDKEHILDKENHQS